MPPGRAAEAIAALRTLVDAFPPHRGLAPVVDAGVEHGVLFVRESRLAHQTLADALREYGPAHLGDVVPRLQALAEALDLGAARGLSHLALTTETIWVSEHHTELTGLGIVPVLTERGLIPGHQHPTEQAERAATDVAALARVSAEWAFGSPWPANDDARQPVPSLRGVDGRALALVFRRATTVDSEARFATCQAFVQALAATLGTDETVVAATSVDELMIHATGDRPADDDTVLPTAVAVDDRSSVTRWMIAAVVVAGMALGAMGYWAFNRPPAPAAVVGQTRTFTDGPLAASIPSTTVPDEPALRPADAPRPIAPAPAATVPPAAVAEPPVTAGMLVHSTPPGAAVAVDGVARGITPVAVRGLEIGTRTVSITLAGYRPVQRQVALTSERPSRTVEVDLAPAVSPVPRPDSSARTNGALVVDSRPEGAAVRLDGKPVGTTPLVIGSLEPGTYTVEIQRPGYRPVTTTVDVRPALRARVAVRLEGGS